VNPRIREGKNPRIRENEEGREWGSTRMKIREGENEKRKHERTRIREDENCEDEIAREWREDALEDEDPRGRGSERTRIREDENCEDKIAREWREDALELVKRPCHGNTSVQYVFLHSARHSDR
jgi:hypothetical protein